MVAKGVRRCVGFVVLVACGSADHSEEKVAPIPPKVPSPCEVRFAAERQNMVPLLAVIGAGNDAPIEPAAACAQMSGKPDLAYYFDGTKARERALGAPVPEAASKPRIEKLAGRYSHPTPPGSLDDAVVWSIGANGSLVIERTTAGKKPVTTKEPERLLVFTRDRQLAIVTGSSKQFVPVFVDDATGDLLLSWTTGAMAAPIVDAKTYALPLDTDDRWIVRANDKCHVVDPKAAPREVPCRDEDQRFVVELDGKARAWTRHDKFLVPSAMERFAKLKK